jgi:hypothetical protein
MHSASLPAGARPDRGDGLLEAQVIVADDQPDPAQAPGHQAAPEAGLSGVPEVVRVIGQVTCRGMGGGDGDLQSRPRISRCPLAFAAVAIPVATLTTRPPSRQRWISASSQTEGEDPRSGERLRKLSTLSASGELDHPGLRDALEPMAGTGASTCRVDTPST